MIRPGNSETTYLTQGWAKISLEPNQGTRASPSPRRRGCHNGFFWRASPPRHGSTSSACRHGATSIARHSGVCSPMMVRTWTGLRGADPRCLAVPSRDSLASASHGVQQTHGLPKGSHSRLTVATFRLWGLVPPTPWFPEFEVLDRDTVLLLRPSENKPNLKGPRVAWGDLPRDVPPGATDYPACLVEPVGTEGRLVQWQPRQILNVSVDPYLRGAKSFDDPC